MPLRKARQPENTGSRHSSSNDGWKTQCIGSGLSRETPAGSRRSLPLRPGQRDRGGPSWPMLLLYVWEPFFADQSWFLRRIGHWSSSSGTWRDSAHRSGTLRSNPNESCWLFFFSVFVFSDLVSASRCQVSYVLEQCCFGCSVPVKVTHCARGCACRRD